jgi:spore coat protein A, manganese oxidase
LSKTKYTLASVIFLAVFLFAPIMSLAQATTVTSSMPGMTTPDQSTLDPNLIPKFVNQLVIPPVYVPQYTFDTKTCKITQVYQVDMKAFSEQILPLNDINGNPLAQTPVWGYGGLAKDAVTGKSLGYIQNSPGPSFETIRDVPVQVTWRNLITTPQMFAVDPTIHWANPNNLPMMMPMDPSMPPMDWPAFPPGFPGAQSPVTLVTHLHGGEVQSTSDGGPNAWFTATGVHGSDYTTYKPTSANSAVDYYPNQQLATTLWYHDHAMGLTRINVMSGLAGFYTIRDVLDPVEYILPRGAYEIPIAIQDRSFNVDGTLWFPSTGVTDAHPYWNPEFFGNTIMVNGKVWPNLNVNQGEYRFHLLDGSNARFYNLTFVVKETGAVLPFRLIGTEGGFIKSPVTLKSMLIAPAERPDVLVDFSKVAPGNHVVLTNDAVTPYPMGDPVDANTAQIMQFTVGTAKVPKAAILPNILESTLKTPLQNTANNKRYLPLIEVEDPVTGNPLMVTLNGQSFDGTLTETPKVGSTEDWNFINLTPDTHPMHIHLVQFQLVKRIPFDAAQYKIDWLALNGGQSLPFPDTYAPKTLDPTSYMNTTGTVYPTASELAWKDTIQSPTGWITIVRVRFAPQDTPITGRGSATPGVNLFPFDPTSGPGYVWHCHIIDHEDNEMMRPYIVTK